MKSFDPTPTESVNQKSYRILKPLGHGKGGYSLLAMGDEGFVVLKKIHHEPCSYYQFGNKIQSELHDYRRLKEIGIRMPLLLDADESKEILVKEYLEGKTIAERIEEGEDISAYLPQIEEMAECAKAHGLNIDYYPTNFIVKDGLLYYIDYECNAYMEEWSYPVWGKKYWVKEELVKQNGIL
jgi:hypothetical protein